MIYKDLGEYNIIGDRKTPLLRCIPFVLKLKALDTITTGQYMNCHILSNQQFTPLLKKSSHSIHIELWDTSGDRIPLVSVGITRPVLMFRKASNFHI